MSAVGQGVHKCAWVVRPPLDRAICWVEYSKSCTYRLGSLDVFLTLGSNAGIWLCHLLLVCLADLAVGQRGTRFVYTSGSAAEPTTDTSTRVIVQFASPPTAHCHSPNSGTTILTITSEPYRQCAMSRLQRSIDVRAFMNSIDGAPC